MKASTSTSPKKEKNKMKFNDSPENFCELIALLGFAGQLKKKRTFYAFHTDSGAVINWWPTTGTIQVQGAALPKVIVTAALGALFALAKKGSAAALVPDDAPLIEAPPLASADDDAAE